MKKVYKGVFTYYVNAEGGERALTNNYGGGGAGWPYHDINKNIFFYKMK